MVKSFENGVSLAPFLVKFYEMVNDDSTNELISWADSNDSFIIFDESKFSSQLLPKYFKHSNFSSFVRQLNIYGFRKIDSDKWEFANEFFVKGQKHLLKNITRRKNPPTLSQQKSSQEKDIDTLLASEAEKKLALKKDIESLKTDKIALTQELAKLRQHQEMSQSNLVLLGEQIKGMEKNQQQMLSFIVMAMQRPDFLMQFLQPNEKKISDVTDDYDESVPSNGMIVRYQPPQYEEPDTTTDFEDFMDFDFSSDAMRDLLLDMDTLFDDKTHPSEDHGQFVLPDIPENDILLERLLLSSPRAEIVETEHEACIDSGMQFGLELQSGERNESSSFKDDVNEYRSGMDQAKTLPNISEHI